MSLIQELVRAVFSILGTRLLPPNDRQRLCKGLCKRKCTKELVAVVTFVQVSYETPEFCG